VAETAAKLRGMIARIALAIVTVAALTQVRVPAVAAGGPVSGDLSTASSSQVGRPTLSATSQCGVSFATGQAGTGSTRHYISWAFTVNFVDDQCVSFDWSANKNVDVAAYVGGFNANTVAAYLSGGNQTGDSCMGTAGSFSFLLPAGESFLIVASECQPGAGGKVDVLIDSVTPVTYGVDNRIRKGSGSLVGDDVYSSNAFGQSVGAITATSKTARFTISIQNESSIPLTFVVYAWSPPTTGYKVKFFRGTTDITSLVFAGTYNTDSVAPGGTFAIKLRVKVLASAPAGSGVDGMVSATPSGSPLMSDTVGFGVSRK
jgi:hypothetical protein